MTPDEIVIGPRRAGRYPECEPGALYLHVRIRDGVFRIWVEFSEGTVYFSEHLTHAFPEVPYALAEWHGFNYLDNGNATLKAVFELGYGDPSVRPDWLDRARQCSKLPDLTESDFNNPKDLERRVRARHAELVTEFNAMSLAGFLVFPPGDLLEAAKDAQLAKIVPPPSFGNPIFRTRYLTRMKEFISTMKLPTTKDIVAKLLLNHHTAEDAAAIANVSVSYARTIRRDLVADGKLPKAPGRGRPRKERVS